MFACTALLAQPARKGEAAVPDRPMQEATAVKERHIDFLLGLPAVVGAGIGTSNKHPGKAVIQVFVRRRLIAKERRAFPSHLEGVPVRIIKTGSFRALPAAKKPTAAGRTRSETR
jgi:hypothetical protein